MIIQSTRGLLSIGIIFLFSISGIAQNQTNNWIFSIYCALDFNSGSPIPFDASTSIDTWEGSASISNNIGELLLFSDGSTVWNANQEIMPNGTSLGGDKSSTQSALIIKKPESDDIYYLFTVDDIGGPDGLRYSEIDMALDGGLGDITETKNVLIENSMTEKLTAVLHNNGTDIWVLSQKAGSNIYHSYIVSVASVDEFGIESLFSSEIGFSHDELNIQEENETNQPFELMQNRPNPFDEATIIGVRLNEYIQYKTAYISIRDMNGREIEQLPIELNNEMAEVVYHHGYGRIGTFAYTLVVDGEERATKMMVFAN